VKHFLVLRWLLIKADYRNSVSQLISEWIDRIINKDHIWEFSVCNDPQVFHVEAFRGRVTVMPIESMLDKAAIRIQVV
jgi:hypothetical protein